MPKSYSEDLRWRAVWLHIAQGMSYADISRMLYMSEIRPEIHGTLRCYERSCTNCPKKRTRQDSERVWTVYHPSKSFSQAIIIPTWGSGTSVSNHRCLGAFLHYLLYNQGAWVTRKRVCRIALQWSEDLWLQFMAEILMYDPDMLMWTNETGSARRNSIRQYVTKRHAS